MRNPEAPEAAGRTGHARYAEMCDESHPGFDPERCDGYRPLVSAILRGEPVGAGPAAATRTPAGTPYEPLTRSWLARVNTCPFRECPAGCRRTRCHAGRGDRRGNTSLENCRACLRAADPEPEARP